MFRIIAHKREVNGFMDSVVIIERGFCFHTAHGYCLYHFEISEPLLCSWVCAVERTSMTAHYASRA